MHTLKTIRARLGTTQKEFASGLGCSQGNVANYERGQALPPEAAKRVIAFAASKGMQLTMGQIYGLEPLHGQAPQVPTPTQPATHQEVANG